MFDRPKESVKILNSIVFECVPGWKNNIPSLSHNLKPNLEIYLRGGAFKYVGLAEGSGNQLPLIFGSARFDHHVDCLFFSLVNQ